jgi:hypothetical protein
MIGSQPQHEVRQHPAANPPETWDPDLSSYDFDFDSGFRLPKVLVSQAVTNGPLRPQAAAQPSHSTYLACAASRLSHAASLPILVSACLCR